MRSPGDSDRAGSADVLGGEPELGEERPGLGDAAGDGVEPARPAERVEQRVGTG